MRRKSSALIPLVLLLPGLAAPPAAWAEWPSWAERWLFNPTERTRRALEADEEGSLEAAAEPLETALRLERQSPVAQYNAGTSRLRTGGDAQSLLEEAARTAPDDLAAQAHYNLGNARLEAGNYQAAIEAYKDTLRRDSKNADAKHNLELARRLLEQQQQQEQDQQQQQNQDQQEQDQQQDQQEQDQQQQDQQQQDQQDQQQQDQQQQDQQQQDQQQQDQQQQDQQQQDQQEQDQQQQESGEQEGPLPQFENLPDMSAEEAAAILEAVENMERERRRQEAREAAKVNARGKKDW